MTLLDDILHDLLSPTAPGRALLCADRCSLGAPRVPGPCAPRLLWPWFQNCPWCGRLRLKHVKSSFWGSVPAPRPFPEDAAPLFWGGIFCRCRVPPGPAPPTTAAPLSHLPPPPHPWGNPVHRTRRSVIPAQRGVPRRRPDRPLCVHRRVSRCQKPAKSLGDSTCVGRIDKKVRRRGAAAL